MQRRSVFAILTALPAAILGRSALAASQPAPVSPHKGYCWNADDWEYTYDQQDIACSLADDLPTGDVMRVGRAVAIPDIWIAYDENRELHEFATEAEAKAMAARALAAGMLVG